MSVREQLSDDERCALIEAAIYRLTGSPNRLPDHERQDLVTAMAKLTGTDTEVIVMRAYSSLR